MSDCAVAAILNCAIAFDVANRAVAAVLNGAIAFDVAFCAVAAILDRAITFDMACCAVAAVLNFLCIRQSKSEEDCEKEDEVFHVFGE